MGMGFGRGAGLLRGGERIAKQIGLTDAQRRKLREIREDHHRLMIKARADMDLARLDLANLMQDDEASSGSIDRQIDVIAGLQADQMKSMAAAHRAALGVLTAKQRDQLSEWTRRGPGSDDDDDARPRRGSRR
jgi:Spy/CpxP family protein refolding chaperone